MKPSTLLAFGITLVCSFAIFSALSISRKEEPFAEEEAIVLLEETDESLPSV